MIVIPFINYPAFQQSILIEEVLYVFDFHWNYRGNFWSLAIWNQEVLLVGGIKVVLHYDLIGDYCDRGLPNGKLYVIDETGNTNPIDYNDFTGDRRLQLIYATLEELNAI